MSCATTRCIGHSRLRNFWSLVPLVLVHSTRPRRVHPSEGSVRTALCPRFSAIQVVRATSHRRIAGHRCTVCARHARADDRARTFLAAGTDDRAVLQGLRRLAASNPDHVAALAAPIKSCSVRHRSRRVAGKPQRRTLCGVAHAVLDLILDLRKVRDRHAHVQRQPREQLLRLRQGQFRFRLTPLLLLRKAVLSVLQRPETDLEICGRRCNTIRDRLDAVLLSQKLARHDVKVRVHRDVGIELAATIHVVFLISRRLRCLRHEGGQLFHRHGRFALIHSRHLQSLSLLLRLGLGRGKILHRGLCSDRVADCQLEH
eukprot:5069017-Prymnesium_polylepis.1